MENDVDASEAVAISDPLDEVLQQVSELTLRTNHIDAAVKGLENSITDLGETTHTGLVEIRGLLVQAHTEAGPPASSAVAERLEVLEISAARSARQRGILTALLVASVAIGVVNLAMTWGSGSKKKGEDIAFTPPPAGPAAVSVSTPAPAITPVVPATVPSLDPVKTPGKDPKATHHHNHH